MTALVMVHGFMGGSAQWKPQREIFQDRFDLIAVDLPGFGENASLNPIDSIGGFADWVLDEVRGMGVTRFHLLGHSMGGMIAQEMVRRAPDMVDKLILYGTGACGALPGRFETIEESKRRAIADGPQQTARRIAATWFLDGMDAPAFEDCAVIAEKSSATAIAAGLDAMATWDARHRLGEISSRTLVLWGDCDRTYSWEQVEEIWTNIPRAELAVAPNCAHAVHLENPELFNLFSSDFLCGTSG